MSVAAPTTTTTTMTATMTTVAATTATSPTTRGRARGERCDDISIVILGLRENVVALPLGHVAEALVTVPLHARATTRAPAMCCIARCCVAFAAPLPRVGAIGGRRHVMRNGEG